MIPSLAGQMPEFAMPLIVSTLEYGRVSGTLRVISPEGQGEIGFSEGRIISAECGKSRGDLAVYICVSKEKGTFSFVSEQLQPQPELTKSNQGLLMEAMRLLDECRSNKSGYERTREYPAGIEKFSEYERLALASLSVPASVGQIASACQISELEAVYYLDRLEIVGAVSRCKLVEQERANSPRPAEINGRIRVLVVDDSVLMRRALTRLLEGDYGFEVVGTASNGQEALELLPKLRPNVVSLDLYMPVMDGVQTLKHIMLTRPTPTVMVSAASPEALDLTFESILRFGALDFITKPSHLRGGMDSQVEHILRRVKKAAKANLRGIRMVQPPLPSVARKARRGPCRAALVASAGAGGCLSYVQLVTSLPHDLPIAIVGMLRFPEDFLRAFVQFLSKRSPFSVEVVEDGMPLESGVCYLSSSPSVRLDSSGNQVRLRVDRDGQWDPNLCFMDAAKHFGVRAVGLLLSGDTEQSAGLGSIRAAGGVTMAQVPASCVDPEQCERAIELGLVDRIVLPTQVPTHVSQLLLQRRG